MKAAVIDPKTVARFTGKTVRTSRYLLERIKTQLQKQPHQVVTIDEFCNFMGVNRDEVERYL